MAQRQMVVLFLFLFVCMCVCERWGGRETEKGKEGELDRKGRMVMMSKCSEFLTVDESRCGDRKTLVLLKTLSLKFKNIFLKCMGGIVGGDGEYLISLLVMESQS